MSDVREIIIQLAKPGGRYPDGLVEHGYYYEESGHVYLCDARGTKTGVSKVVKPPFSAEETALRLLKLDVGRSDRFSDFNRPIYYPKGY
jgi:hypothetical protein